MTTMCGPSRLGLFSLFQPIVTFTTLHSDLNIEEDEHGPILHSHSIRNVIS